MNLAAAPFHLSSKIVAVIFFVFALTGCACSDNRKPEADKQEKNNRQEVAIADRMQSTGSTVNEAMVEVKGVGTSEVRGKVTFTKVSGGVRIVADVDGLKPGKHGFHVHEHGDCGGTGAAAAGGHFNPTNKKHGCPESAERHMGDLGNLVANESGHAHYDRIDKGIALDGEYSIIGRSIIIHADPDDCVTQPTGNSGARIGCGFIEARKE